MSRSWPSLALTLALAAACAEAERPDDDGVIVTSDDAHGVVAPLSAVTDEPFSICDYLPESGPCALLCDHDALVAEYVPEGVCVVFACELTNGRTVTAHACHRPD